MLAAKTRTDSSKGHHVVACIWQICRFGPNHLACACRGHVRVGVPGVATHDASDCMEMGSATSAHG